MSEKSFPHGILQDVSHSASALKANVVQTQRREEKESNPLLADDAVDDSSSSYCTALCSLSEYSEALEDELHMIYAEAQCKTVSPKPRVYADPPEATSTFTSPEVTALLQELKAKEDEDIGALQDIQSEQSLCRQDEVPVSATDHHLLQSITFPPGPKIGNLSPINISYMDAEQDRFDSLNLSRKDTILKPWDCFRTNKTSTQPDIKLSERLSNAQPRLTKAVPMEQQCKPGEAFTSRMDFVSVGTKYVSIHERNLQNRNNLNAVDTGANTIQSLNSCRTDSLLESMVDFRNSKTADLTYIKHFEEPDCLESQFTSNTVLTSSAENQYSQEVRQEQSGNKPKEDFPTQRRLNEGPSKHSPQRKLDEGGSIISHMKWEGEEQSEGVEKEQAKLSLKARNRKPPASCISTLTANKQKSGIPPRCYSERFLATGHQHPPRSPPVSWRWQKQSRQGGLLLSSLPPKPRSSTRQHCSTVDTEDTEGPYSMATKLAETNTEVRCLANLDHTRSSHSEANYLDVFNPSCWSSNQLFSDGSFHDCSKDALSFKLPMVSTNNNNTSACSEASSFECIDVALENHEEVNRGAKTVPKRQIQLKRRETVESHTNESNNGILQVPDTPSRPRDILQRQHSTPASFHQDSHESEPKSGQTERKQRLQKSLSLDETSGKTKMASCIIKTVLSKKMQQEENLRALEVSFAPIKVCNKTIKQECLTASAKEVFNETTKVMGTCSLLRCSISSKSPTQKSDSQTMGVKEDNSIGSKTQPKLITKQNFVDLFSGVSRTKFHGGVTEITASPETEKEKMGPSKEVAWLSIQNPGEKLSCDSAKGKAWNLSAVISGAIGKQATVKTTPEECCTVQRGHKLHNVKTDPITSLEKQEKKGERKESIEGLTMIGFSSQSVVSSLCSPVKEQERDNGEPRPFGQLVNMSFQSQGKFKAKAPVHVVRDMRSLVKNTYSQSLKVTGEAAQGPEDSSPGFPSVTPYQVRSKGEDKRKRYKHDEKPQVRKVTPPLGLDRARDLASLHASPRGCATKATSFLESHDKTPSAGFTKVNPIIAAKENSCALLKSPEALDSPTVISQVDIQGSNLKQTNQAAMAQQANKEISTEISKNGQCVDSSQLAYEKHSNSVEHQKQHLAAVLQYCPPTARSIELDSCKPSEQMCSAIKDGHQTPGPPPRSQNATGPPSACILTVTPTPMLPPYFCKPNPLGYQTISPHMGAVSYVQGPVLLQTPSHNQPSTANGPVPLMRSLSEEVRLLSQPSPADGNTVQHSSSKETENEEARSKMPSPETQPCTAFVATLGAEVMRGGMLCPEMGGGLAQSSRQLLLDPETGRCFYVDMPQLPQRKMLFDPETCQYVEVLLPQQTLSSTVVSSPCAIPFPSLHIPAIYTPHCLPYVQVHPQVLLPPGP